MNKAQLVEAVLHLPRQDRAEIATTVLRSLDDDLAEPEVGPEEWERVWGEEVARRIEDLDRGDATAIPAEQVFKNLRDRVAGLKRGG